MNAEERLNELESRLAFQDDTLNTLNDVLVSQQRQIELLELRLAGLARRHDELAGQMESNGPEAPPPHY
jgi:SlyX protein